MASESPWEAPTEVAEIEATGIAAKRYRLFSSFLKRVWKHLNLPPPTPVQIDMANFLQFGPRKAMLEAFRGVGKSWITAAFVVWSLYHDPQLKIEIVSASKEYADTMSSFVRQLIGELPEMEFLLPDRRRGQRDAASQFDVGPSRIDKSPSVKSVGITGQLTGSRADIIVIDDVETPKNSFTAGMRERLKALVGELSYVIKPEDESVARMIYLGTPQTEMSLYNGLPAHGFVVRVWPARVPENPGNYRGNLAPFVQKMIDDGVKALTPVDPKRFHEAELIRREIAAGRSGFQLQFMLDTSLTDTLRFPLRADDMVVMALDPEKAPMSLAWAKDPRYVLNDLPSVGLAGDCYYGPAFLDDKWAPFQGSVLAIDPAGRGEDEIGYAVVRMLHGRLFLVASGGLRGGYSTENLTALANVAKKHKVNAVTIEKNFGDGMFGALLKPVLASVWPVTIEESLSTGQKETRIIGVLEPVMNGHRLVVDRAVVEADLEVLEPVYSLFYQMARLTKEKGALAHDDRLEALSMAVHYWQGQMEVDAEKAAQRSKDDEMDDLLRAFAEDAPVGIAEMIAGPSKANWHGY